MNPSAPTAYGALVLADRADVSGPLADRLRTDGHDVTRLESLAQVEVALRLTVFDVALVDLRLRGAGGLNAVRAIRQAAPDALLLVITDGQSGADIVMALDAGADDYVPGPVDLDLLMARLRARRRPAAATAREGRVLTIDDVVVDLGSRRCHVGAGEVLLRAKEFDLLALLMQLSGFVVSRLDLMSQVWDENWSGSTKTLDVTMAGLRRHLREVALAEGATVPQITTMRGRGYRLDPRADQVAAG
jgi:DNA-binding response OmpR family regulator